MRCVNKYSDIEVPEYKDSSDYYDEFLEKYVDKWGEQTDEDYDIIQLYWNTLVTDYLDESALDTSVNDMRESLVWYFKHYAEQKVKDIKVLEEQYTKQKEINKELVDENESLKVQIEQEKNLSQCMSDHNEQLRGLIQKMKCCANCKHSRTEYEHCKTDKHEKWEIKEK